MLMVEEVGESRVSGRSTCSQSANQTKSIVHCLSQLSFSIKKTVTPPQKKTAVCWLCKTVLSKRQDITKHASFTLMLTKSTVNVIISKANQFITIYKHISCHICSIIHHSLLIHVPAVRTWEENYYCNTVVIKEISSKVITDWFLIQ